MTDVARVAGRWPLFYAAGADAAADRPAHVRAGSGLAWCGDRLAVAQDDALWLALVDPLTRRVGALPLPALNGVRLFGEDRGNKAAKADFEAIVALPDGRLLLVGSGSTAKRMRWMLVTVETGAVAIHDATMLYAQLATLPGFATAELNIEGATLHAGMLWFGQRSNGSATSAEPRVDALATVDLGQTLRWIAGEGPVPVPQWRRNLDLGVLGEVRLTLTDLCSRGGKLWFVAAAEDSPDAYHDGAVVGSALGWIAGDTIVVMPLLGDDGGVVACKVEGLAGDRADAGTFWAVVDADDVSVPCALLHVKTEQQ